MAERNIRIVQNEQTPCVAEQPSWAIHYQLRDIWEALLHRKVTSIDDSFFALGGTDEDAMKMLADVESLTGRQIPWADFTRHPTIRGATRLLIPDTDDAPLFLQIQKGAKHPPFYFFHGDILGGGFYAQRLATLLGSDQPFYISPPLRLNRVDLPDIPEIAARKRRALRTLQPHGPYVLGGFCVGAVVAYEVARQLHANGEEVRSVILIEPEVGDIFMRLIRRFVNKRAAPGAHSGEKVADFARRARVIEKIEHIWNLPGQEKLGFLTRKSRQLFRKYMLAEEEQTQPSVRNPTEFPNEHWPLSAYRYILSSYVPLPYEGRVSILATDELYDYANHIVRHWGKAAPRATWNWIPGGHLTCITTYVEEIAARIRDELHQVRVIMTLISSSLASTVCATL